MAAGQASKRDRCVGRAGNERGERIAQSRTGGGLTARMTIGQVNKPALPVVMLKRMQQRCLPSGKQRDGKKDPCETG